MSRPSYSIKLLPEEIQAELNLHPDLADFEEFPYWEKICEELERLTGNTGLDPGEEEWDDKKIAKVDVLTGEVVNLIQEAKELKEQFFAKLTELATKLAENVIDSGELENVALMLGERVQRRMKKRKFLKQAKIEYLKKCKKAGISERDSEEDGKADGLGSSDDEEDSD